MEILIAIALALIIVALFSIAYRIPKPLTTVTSGGPCELVTCEFGGFNKADLETAMAEAVKLDRESLVLLMTTTYGQSTEPIPFKNIAQTISDRPIIASASTEVTDAS